MQLDKFEGADFEYDNIIFNYQPANTHIRNFWSQIWGFLYLHQTSQQNKFEDAVFKYGNIILKFQPQNTQTFFGHKFKGFYFLPQTLQ